MDLHPALDFARSHKQAVLATTRSNGRPQLSNVLYTVAHDGVIRVSITADRAKYKNLRRDAWGAIHVSRDDFFAYVVIEGSVELSDVIESPDDPAADELVELYRTVAGEHPDWDEYRRALVDERRVVVRLRPDRAYGMLGDLPPASGT